MWLSEEMDSSTFFAQTCTTSVPIYRSFSASQSLAWLLATHPSILTPANALLSFTVARLNPG
jgi:hypothetical protein